MKIVLDFDNTLFETEHVKQVLLDIAKEHGASPEEAQNIYLQARNDGERAVFTIQRFCDVLNNARGESASIDATAVRDRIFKDAGVVEGAEGLLQELKQRNVELFLLSLGESTYQNEKVDIAGLKKFFDEGHIVYTENASMGKIEMLKQLFGHACTGREIILFNDKPDETSAILEAFPEMRAYVRQASLDDRYTERDFCRLLERYSGRVVCENDLQKGIQFIFSERYDGIRK